MTGILILCCLVLAALIWWERKKQQLEEGLASMIEADDDHCVTKHEQVAVLRSVGLLLPEAEERELLWRSSPEQSEFYARYPYWGLLGSPELTWNRVWSPGDEECIDDEDAYAPVFRGLARISGLPLENIRGVDRYYADFTFAGEQVSFHAKENNDWLDLRVGGFLNRLTDRRLPETAERFWLDGTHPAPLWLWAMEEQIRTVNEKTGLSFRKA